MKKENIKKVGVAVLLLTILLLAGGVTYAYFSSNISGTNEEVTLSTGTLAITFSDNNTGITANSLVIGESTTKEFKIENTGTLDVTTNILWENLINTFTYGSLSYTFQYKTSESSEWVTTPLASGNIPLSFVASDYNLATDITVPAGATYYYKLTLTYNYLDDVDQTDDASSVLTANFRAGDKVENPVLTTLAALGKTVQSSTPDFSTVATTDETANGLYSMADDYGTSYYYRGAVTDNYVKFAGFYWRIIRVNGDGSIRMIYDGTQAYANGTSSASRLALTTKTFNTTYSDNAYVGYMYGTTGSSTYSATHTNTNNSTIKGLIDSWYESNLKTNYATYIADVIYCNDRSTPGSSVSLWTSDTGLGYAKNVTAYGAVTRFLTGNSSSSLSNRTDPAPQFTCPQQNDAFTVSDTTNGNGALTYPIGLITADEISTAGGSYTSENTVITYIKGLSTGRSRLSPSPLVITLRSLQSTALLGCSMSAPPGPCTIL